MKRYYTICILLIALLLSLTMVLTACGTEYTVEFCGADNCTVQKVKAGKRAEVPATPERNSFAFDKWLLDGKEYDFDTKVNSDIKLTASWKMIDYAENVYLNTEKYPLLNDQGLFTLTWDETTNALVSKRAWSADGAAAIDPNKPTAIFIHGWQATVPNAQIKRPPDTLNPTLVDVSYYTDADLAADGKYYQPKTWLDEGWNVLSFDYNRFAVAFIFEAEESIYYGGHLAFMDNEGNWSDYDASEYSLCQFFAAEYIRTMKAVGPEMGKEEIRVTGHSLGGIMTVTSSNLIYELSKEGQLPASQVPERLALLDTYVTFSEMVGALLSDAGAKHYASDTPISWSGLAPVENDKGKTYLSYVKNMSEAGIAIELYLLDADGAFNAFRVPMLSFDGRILQVMDYAASVIYVPKPVSSNMAGEGHNAIRELYYESIVRGIGLDGGGEGVSAKMSTADILANKGVIYRITSGDDAFKTDLMTMEVTDKDDYGCTYTEQVEE